MNYLKGGIHLHSTYSYDGTISLENIVEKFRELHFDFVIITEHNDGLRQTVLQEIIIKCKQLSSNKFTVIPGIEIRCKEKDVHLMGFGENVLRVFRENIPLIDAIKSVKELGGLAVLAHPPDDFDIKYSECLPLLDGLEIWNNKRDSRWSPRIRSIHLLKRTQKIKENILAFAGFDFHDYWQLPTPYINVLGDKNNTADILISIKSGHFYMDNQFLKIPGIGELSRTLCLKIAIFGIFKKFLPLINSCVTGDIRNYLKKLFLLKKR